MPLKYRSNKLFEGQAIASNAYRSVHSGIEGLRLNAKDRKELALARLTALTGLNQLASTFAKMIKRGGKS